MPRRNKHKKEPHFHGATVYDTNFKAECYGCAFAGRDFKCLAADGECLKAKPGTKDEGDAAAK